MILEAYDLTRCAWSAAPLAGCDPKTITHYVSVRDGGGDPYAVTRRARLLNPFLDKVEELVDRSEGKVRADKVHERIVAMGFVGDERSTGGPSRRQSRLGGTGIGGGIGRGCPSRGCGCSSTGVRAPRSAAEQRACSACGWPGRGSGW